MRDYYCSRKFSSFKIDIEKKNIYNCCKADGENIKVNALDKTNSLFNTDLMKRERQLMLNNKRIKSCEKACWIPEDKGKWSLRLETQSNKKHYTNIIAKPEELDIQLSSDCNLTCSYCCKEFSSAWRRDIIHNGDYNDHKDNRYNLRNIDKVLERLSQKSRQNSAFYSQIKKELVETINDLKLLVISGGEPFLHNDLILFVNVFQNVPTIKIIS